MKRTFAGLVVMIAWLLWAAPAGAQPPTGNITDDQVNEVAKDLYCPVCESTPLDVCPTLACISWRETIREQLAAGSTKQQIMDYFAAQYGDRVLAEPPRRGVTWLIWLLPVVTVAFGAVFFGRYLKSIQIDDEPPAPAARALDAPAELPLTAAADDAELEPYIARIEAELNLIESTV